MSTIIKISNVFACLTTRQSEILALLLEGKTNKEIGQELRISPRTVEDHRSDIYVRTGEDNILTIAHRIYGSPIIIP